MAVFIEAMILVDGWGPIEFVRIVSSRTLFQSMITSADNCAGATRLTIATAANTNPTFVSFLSFEARTSGRWGSETAINVNFILLMINFLSGVLVARNVAAVGSALFAMRAAGCGKPNAARHPTSRSSKLYQ
jgi:hypothetical protein